LDTTDFEVTSVLPAFFTLDVCVFASTRLTASLSPPKIPVPENGASLPSRLLVKLYEIGLPSAPIPSTVTLPRGSMVRVALCGGFSPLYFDFATFNFQVPTNGLSWASRQNHDRNQHEYSFHCLSP